MQEFRINDWRVRPERNTIANDHAEHRLEPRVMDLLVYFAHHPGEVLSADEILSHVWPHSYVSDSALQTAVSALRKAFGDRARHPHILETIPKRGYRLIAESSAAKPLVAILPFTDLSGGADPAYLVDGVTDTLIAALGRHASIRVISRHSVMGFRDSDLPLPRIAAELGVQYVVEGSVRIEGRTIDLTIKVIDAMDPANVRVNTYQSDLRRLFELQHHIAREIGKRLTDSPTQVPDPGPAADIDPDAVIDYLRGRFHWDKMTPAHFARALDYFQAAVKRSPGFAAAHAGIADVWGAYGYWGLHHTRDVRGPLLNAVERALAIDPDSAEANVLAGAFQFHIAHDWEMARSYLERAMALDPSLAHARMLMTLFLGTLHDPSALTMAEEARRLNPLAPPGMLARAMCLSSVERYADVARELERMREIDPAFPPAWELEADLLWLTDDPEAMAAERRIWQAEPDVLGLLDDGAPDECLVRAATYLQQSSGRYVSPRVIARLLSVAGHIEHAIDVLHAAVQDHNLMQLDFVQMNPSFAAVRRHPHYGRVTAALGLPLDG